MDDLTKFQLNRNILCIDLKSFYASVECVLRGLDPFSTPLVVADESRGNGSIILAVSPYLREKGIPSRGRLFELPKIDNLIIAKPQMQTYLKYSADVVGVYLNYVSDDDLYVYSIDEAFLDVTTYLEYYKLTDYELAFKILNEIEETLLISATCGIGPNMLMAKLSLDIAAKKSSNGIAKWNYIDLPNKLWKVKPLSKMWGIGSRMEEHLNKLGLYEIGDIAKYSKEKLKKRFGILGEELWYHTHGIDLSQVQDKYLLRSKSQTKSFGISQVLFRSYNAKEILTIILEMTDDVTRRLRISKFKTKTIKLTIGYSKNDYGGFSRQCSLDQSTNSVSEIYKTLLELFDTFYEGYPIRQVAISLTNLDNSKVHQLSLFEDSTKLDEEYRLQVAIDKIKIKYGKNAITRAVSEEEHSTAKMRNKQMGGHHV